MAATTEGYETLSSRAQQNVGGVDHWAPITKALSDPWSAENPGGTIILGLAENTLMHVEIHDYFKKNITFEPARHFTYGNGPRGSHKLRDALANLFNTRFHPFEPVASDDFLITSGVAGAIDDVAWSLCDDGEGILFPQPLYTGFNNDVRACARAKIVPVPFARPDGSVQLEDLFDPEANFAALERAWKRSVDEGTVVKAVMITNPHNPTGRCYPVETIKAIARFCASHDLHYIADEIYALSTFENPEHSNTASFQSVLSVDLRDILPKERIHVLYGAAKDFNANGLRLGVLHTRNAALRQAVLSLLPCAWVPYVIQDLWAGLLDNKPFLDAYLITNSARLGANYRLTIDFLRANNIDYFPGSNAAIFLWVDLRRRLLPPLLRRGADVPEAAFALGGSATTTPATSGSLRDTLIARQHLLDATCKRRGVWIGNGLNFTPEEVGWFRVVFSAREEALREGLMRFLAAVEEVEAIE